jgi:hypothetical protein
MLFRYKIVFLSCFLLIACDVVTWKKVPPEISQTAVANDGSDVAVVMRNYEKNQAADKDASNVFGLSRNYEHQIFIQNHDGSQRRSITPKRPYKDDYPFYYLKTAGYILLGVMLNDKASTVRYEKIDLATGQATTVRTQSNIPQHVLCKDRPPPSFVVESVAPSPDGAIIAHFYSPTCLKATVEFLEAKTLTILDTQQIDIQGVYDGAVWPSQDGLILYSRVLADENNAWKLLPKNPPVAIRFTPPTT